MARFRRSKRGSERELTARRLLSELAVMAFSSLYPGESELGRTIYNGDESTEEERDERPPAICDGTRATSRKDSPTADVASEWTIASPERVQTPPRHPVASSQSKIWTVHALRALGTSIIGQSADFYRYTIDGTMTDPKSLFRVMYESYIRYHVWNGVRIATERPENLAQRWAIAKDAIVALLVGVGSLFLEQVQGPHWIHIDPRHHDKREDIIAQAISFLDAFESQGVPRDKVIITIPATRRGIHACHELTSSRACNVNLSMVSSLSHAQLCLEAGASSISIPVGRLLYYHERKGAFSPSTRPHPGINAIHEIQAYCRLKKVKTTVICNDLRNLAELQDVGGVDCVALSEFQLEELRDSHIAIENPVLRFASIYEQVSQAEYPTTLLKDFQYIQDCMSPGDYQAFRFVVKQTLKSMTIAMHGIEAVIGGEVRQRMTYTPLPAWKERQLVAPSSTEPLPEPSEPPGIIKPCALPVPNPKVPSSDSMPPPTLDRTVESSTVTADSKTAAEVTSPMRRVESECRALF
ncbi:aldolase [Heliocybe sulcata]|uniref:Aldolase n=1 Tax=Heliocybe sulcata TaxID=5364 RepID=A0A5C3N5A8_9AGAM|nr:aldolase [Heliocybe sulcata]